MQELIQKKLTNSFDLSLSGSNILEELKLNKALNLAKKHAKQGNDDKVSISRYSGEISQKQKSCRWYKNIGWQNFSQYIEIVEPPRDQFSNLVNLYAKGQISSFGSCFAITKTIS